MKSCNFPANRISLPLAAAGCALAGMGLGWLIRPETGPFLPGPADGMEGTRTARTGQAAKPEPSPKTLMLLDFMRGAGSPDARMAAALRLAEELASGEECRDFLENLSRFPGLETAEEMMISVVLRRWLELDAGGASAWCVRHRPAFAARLAGSLAPGDPDKARKVLDSLPPGPVLDAARREFAAALVAAHPERAWAFLAGFPFLDLVPSLVARDVAGARARLEGLAPGLQRAVTEAVAREWIRTDPDAAWAWAGQQPDSPALRGKALLSAFSSSADTACRLLGALPPAEALDLVMRAREKGKIPDPGAVIRALSGNQGLDSYVREAVAALFYGKTRSENPAAAAPLLALWERLRTENEARSRAEALQRNQETAAVGGGFSADNPGAAAAELTGTGKHTAPEWTEKRAAMDWKHRDLFAGLSLPGKSRNPAGTAGESGEPAERLPPDSPESLLEDLGRNAGLKPGDPRILRISPESFSELLSRTEPSVSNAQSALFSEMTARRPELAAKWLETAPLGDQVGARAARFAAHWASEEPAAAAAWVSGLPAGDLAENAAANVARQYRGHDAAAARRWVASLPEGPAREAARRVMAE